MNLNLLDLDLEMVLSKLFEQSTMVINFSFRQSEALSSGLCS